MTDIRKKTTQDFIDAINPVLWAQASRITHKLPDDKKLRYIRALIECAFVIACYTPDHAELLFNLAALPHDSGLDSQIKKIDDEPEDEDTTDEHQKTESDQRRFV